MRSFVYRLVERPTGVVIYVGRTGNPRRREAQHRHTSRGITDVRLELLEEVPPSENPAEHEWWRVHHLERQGHRFLTNVRLRGQFHPAKKRSCHRAYPGCPDAGARL